jgi:hypothetical protein
MRMPERAKDKPDDASLWVAAASSAPASRRNRRAQGNLDTLAVGAVDLFENAIGSDYRPAWERKDVAQHCGVHPSALSKRNSDGRYRCSKYMGRERSQKAQPIAGWTWRRGGGGRQRLAKRDA